MNPREYERMFALEDSYWWYRGMRAIARGFAPDVFAARRILDAGCGTGANLARLGKADVGVDLSLQALRFCRRRGLKRLVAGSVEALPFRASSFGAVISHDVIYTVPDDRRALREMARVCRPRAGLLVSAPAFAWLSGEHDRAVHGLRRYTAAELREKAAAAGFTPDRTTYANFFLVPPVFLVRLLTRLATARRPEDATSDFGLASRPLYPLLYSLLAFEARLVRRVRLPVGVTVFLSAKRLE